jgi:hypothetical protein
MILLERVTAGHIAPVMGAGQMWNVDDTIRAETQLMLITSFSLRADQYYGRLLEYLSRLLGLVLPGLQFFEESFQFGYIGVEFSRTGKQRAFARRLCRVRSYIQSIYSSRGYESWVGSWAGGFGGHGWRCR